MSPFMAYPGGNFKKHFDFETFYKEVGTSSWHVAASLMAHLIMKMYKAERLNEDVECIKFRQACYNLIK